MENKQYQQTTKTLKKALNTFKSIEPLLLNTLNAKEIKYFEEYEDSEILQHLDVYSGIDSMVIYNNNHIRFMANRVQYNNNYKTFTIRETYINSKNTEYLKRSNAIKQEYSYPQLTSQVYVNEIDNKVLSMAFIKTKDLYKYIDDNENKLLYRQANNGGTINKFIVVDWQSLIDNGYLLVVYENGAITHHNIKK